MQDWAPNLPRALPPEPAARPRSWAAPGAVVLAVLALLGTVAYWAGIPAVRGMAAITVARRVGASVAGPWGREWLPASVRLPCCCSSSRASTAERRSRTAVRTPVTTSRG